MKVLYISAGWCGLCKLIKPILDNLMKNDYQKLEYQKLDFDDDFEIVEKYKITSVPTILFLKDSVEVGRFQKEKNQKLNITTSKLKEVIEKVLGEV